jgi:hypothetical protein
MVRDFTSVAGSHLPFVYCAGKKDAGHSRRAPIANSSEESDVTSTGPKKVSCVGHLVLA